VFATSNDHAGAVVIINPGRVAGAGRKSRFGLIPVQPQEDRAPEDRALPRSRIAGS